MAARRDPTPISDDGDVQVFVEHDDAIGYVGTVEVPKPGGPTDNRVKQQQKLDAAIAYFAARGPGSTFSFAGLTNAQKDAHVQRMNAALANVIRHVRGDFSDPGV